MKVSTTPHSEVGGTALAQKPVKPPGGTKRRSISALDDQDCTSVAEWLRTRAADLKSTPRVWLICRPGPDNQALLGTVEAEGLERARVAAGSRWPIWAPYLHAFYGPAVAQIHEKYRRRIARDPFSWAFHEAGHAVVARHLGIEVVSVDILVRMFSTNCQFAPYSDSLGRTLYRKPLHRRMKKERRQEAEETMVCVLAGTAANARNRPGRNHRMSDERDNAAISRLLSAIRPGGEEEYLKEMKARAQELVREHWADIQTVAKALVDRHELTGDDLDDLLKDRTPVRPG